jgi:hypothetical protein
VYSSEELAECCKTTYHLLHTSDGGGHREKDVFFSFHTHTHTLGALFAAGIFIIPSTRGWPVGAYHRAGGTGIELAQKRSGVSAGWRLLVSGGK